MDQDKSDLRRKVIGGAILGGAAVVLVLLIVVEMFVHSLPVIESLDVSAHFATLAAIVTGIVWLGTKIDLVYHLVNSRMTGTLELQALKSFAEGVKAEKDKQSHSSNAPPA